MALWYHFAIMFEALFILTTSTPARASAASCCRSWLGHVWKPLGRTSWYPSTCSRRARWSWRRGATSSCRACIDPLGGINSLWPLFGISNQLLAAVALCVGTTILIKGGKARYAWVTLVPLAWVLTVTLTAGWQKMFAADPRLGFLSHAARTVDQVAAGSLDAARGARLIFNDRLDAVVALAFMTVTVLVVAASAREWMLVLTRRRPAPPRSRRSWRPRMWARVERAAAGRAAHLGHAGLRGIRRARAAVSSRAAGPERAGVLRRLSARPLRTRTDPLLLGPSRGLRRYGE